MTGEGGDSASASDRFADSAAAAIAPRTTVGGGEGVHANVGGRTTVAVAAAAVVAAAAAADSVGSVLGKKVAAADAPTSAAAAGTARETEYDASDGGGGGGAKKGIRATPSVRVASSCRAVTSVGSFASAAFAAFAFAASSASLSSRSAHRSTRAPPPTTPPPPRVRPRLLRRRARVSSYPRVPRAVSARPVVRDGPRVRVDGQPSPFLTPSRRALRPLIRRRLAREPHVSAQEMREVRNRPARPQHRRRRRLAGEQRAVDALRPLHRTRLPREVHGVVVLRLGERAHVVGVVPTRMYEYAPHENGSAPQLVTRQSSSSGRGVWSGTRNMRRSTSSVSRSTSDSVCSRNPSPYGGATCATITLGLP